VDREQNPYQLFGRGGKKECNKFERTDEGLIKTSRD